MLKKLRRKFILGNMALVTALLLLIFGLTYHFTSAQLERDSLLQLEAAAEEAFRPGPASPAASRLPCAAVRLGPQGEIISAIQRNLELTQQDLLAIVSAAVADGSRQGLLREQAFRFLRRPAPGGELLVFADISGEQAALSGLVRTCLLLGAAGFAGFFLISLLLARWAAGPVEKAWAQQRQFVADASHELKTPLTVILTNAQLLQPEGAEKAAILTMSRRMGQLLEQLLTLARTDRALPVREPVDLSALVEDSVLPFEPVFFEKGLSLACRVQPGLTVLGDPAALEQVVEILLDNAQKYSDPAGETTVTLTRQGRRALLTVADPGPAIPPEERERLFHRFYRGDKARSAGGFGLGLSIAHAILTRHQGRIWMDSREGQNCFFAELPLAGRG